MSTRSPNVASPPVETLVVGDLSFEVHRSATRRTIGITVDRDGSLIAHAPNGFERERLAAFAQDKRMWVYTKLAEKDLLLSSRPEKQFVTGEGFTYLGRSHRLLLVNRQAVDCKLDHGRLKLRRAVARSGNGPAAVIDWYRRRGMAWLPERIAPWSLRMDVEPSGVDVRDLGYRWGSLGSHGRLNLHWATMQLSPPQIDYVIVHELAHIREPHHTPEFWLVVERALPGYEHVKAALAKTGSSLWLGQIAQ